MCLGYNMYLVHNSWIFTILDLINLVLLISVSFYICTNTPSMETSWVLLGLACFFIDLNKLYLPTYLLERSLANFYRQSADRHMNL